jgi:putative ABC transport system ATP-binding protein
LLFPSTATKPPSYRFAETFLLTVKNIWNGYHMQKEISSNLKLSYNRKIMQPMILRADKISKEYFLAGQKISVLKNISLTVNKGEFVVIAGSSGSGKTTLLSVLSGLDQPSSGRISLSGSDITDLTEDQLAPIRNELTGFVFQSFHLIPSLNGLENVMFPAELKKDADALSKAKALLERVGLGHRGMNFPEQLSGGEQQRVAICRALINDPEIVFADEPTGNLDSENSEGIIKLLLDLHSDRQMTLVMATHSRSLASRADRVIRLHDGRILEEQSAQ